MKRKEMTLKKVQVVTLGCSKNLVDSEYLLKQLKESGMEVIHADVPLKGYSAIINTCGFILDAKKESVDTILEFLSAKASGQISEVFIMGCLTERYREQLEAELPEVDGIFGVHEPRKVVRALGGNYRDELVGERLLTTPGHYAYLKVAEGCNRSCAFCAIPLIRGRQQSVPLEQLVEEARRLAGMGVKELLLIAQDLTAYGRDLYKKGMLPELLDRLAGIEGIEWIRMHYTYPAGFQTEAIISLMRKHRKICRYLDMPVQHASAGILKSMRRGHGPEEIRQIVTRFRKEFPDMVFRTTLITGFPGEGKAEFLELKRFVKEMQFDRLGVFPYSHEEQTPAFFQLEDQVPEKTKKSRVKSLLSLQESISLGKNLARVGQTMRVVIDGKEGKYYFGRPEYDSPEVDQEVLIPARKHGLEIGSFYELRVTGAGAFELFAEPIS